MCGACCFGGWFVVLLWCWVSGGVLCGLVYLCVCLGRIFLVVGCLLGSSGVCVVVGWVGVFVVCVGAFSCVRMSLLWVFVAGCVRVFCFLFFGFLVREQFVVFWLVVLFVCFWLLEGVLLGVCGVLFCFCFFEVVWGLGGFGSVDGVRGVVLRHRSESSVV